MKKFSPKEILTPVISLFIICLVATALLALTNSVTAPLIEKIDQENEMKSRQTVLENAVTFEDAEIEVDGVKYNYAAGLDEGGKIIGYVFTTSAGGYGGDVGVMTGRDAEGKITKIEILSCSDETPGLGQNSKTPKFKDQYAGLEGVIEVIKNAEPQGSQVKAITSATITSKAVTASVNRTLEIYNAIVGGENNG